MNENELTSLIILELQLQTTNQIENDWKDLIRRGLQTLNRDQYISEWQFGKKIINSMCTVISTQQIYF